MNIAKMMQQAKAMQGKMQEMQEKLDHIMVEGTSGGGMVKIVTSCKGACQSVEINPALMSDEKETLEDLIRTAINDARAKADAKTAEETQRMMAELGLPAGALGNGGLPF